MYQYLPHRPEIKICQDDGMLKLNTTTASFGEFIKIKKDAVVLDLATGSGILLLYANRFKPKTLIGVDINQDALKYAEINLKLNNIDAYKLYACDLKEYRGNPVDVVIANPPYFKSDSYGKSIEKHDLSLSLADVVSTSYLNLKPNGTFFLAYDASRLEEVVLALNRRGFNIKEITFLYDFNKQYASSVFIRARRDAKSGLNVIKPIIIRRNIL